MENHTANAHSSFGSDALDVFNLAFFSADSNRFHSMSGFFILPQFGADLLMRHQLTHLQWIFQGVVNLDVFSSIFSSDSVANLILRLGAPLSTVLI